MTIPTIRDAIVAKLRSVADVGVVHDHERYAKEMSALKALYFSAPHAGIRGWFVRHPTIAETDRHQWESVEIARWTIRGYIAFHDANDDTASELVAGALVDRIRTAFREDESLGGAVAQTALSFNGGVGESGLQLEQFEPVMFTDVLCHAITFRLNTVTYLTTNP